MPAIVVIPARHASSRFPGKPLHPLLGKPMIRHVWERCRQAAKPARVIVATDDERIRDVASGFGAEVAMTRPDHPSGTDRVAEAVAGIAGADVVVNVQGDEPLVPPALIDRLIGALEEDPSLDLATAAAPISGPDLIADPNVVKVVVSLSGDALYFSRSPIPFHRAAGGPARPSLRHLGIYAFRLAFLREFVAWPPSPLEQLEQLEQLRALDHGARIRVLPCDEPWPGVDTPEQAAEIERRMREAGF